jgi:SAM-dependent methyltransferase
METREWFIDWFNSPYYSLLYQNRGLEEASLFINNLLAYLQPVAASRMLDVACGRGRHSVLLAQQGFDVTGIDLSAKNIAHALPLEHELLHFYQHDMRLPFRINYYEYVFNFFTSFGYFRTRREHDNAMRTMAYALKENGTIVLDYLNVHYAETHLQHQTEIEIKDVIFFITKWFDETHFYKKIVVEDEARDEPVVFMEKVAKLSLGDFTEMMADYGLQIQEVFGDYTLSRYHSINSPRMIMVAKKIKTV